ncbi:aryl-alcohol dehydrogenase [Fomitopsis serialis]|uniref:aryl-alcohol dehydrogenase n=1 Tax=Fomitopsis serialis TaxID=139415 RepID=UPI002007F4CF|nr:aryl-alcohol dehydrogenase [Neoantrodia serialis]KAH9925272.1 aryl-alcohol dehydrogenase [Neoantrodia serialis]
MAPAYPAAPEPPTRLGYYRQLAPRAAIHVSPLCLGAMSIGDKWDKLGMGAMNKEQSFKLLDAYFDAGGNFIDTASNYQDGSSEEFIGEWAEARGIRDQLIIATKWTNNVKLRDDSVKQKVNWSGNNAKNLKLTVEASLKQLRTSYIDILYMHFWDNHTSVEEVMDTLHHLVVEGKVLYLGVSNTPAWFVTKANTYAKAHGKTPFVIYQAAYSVLQRDIERDILPMCRYEGIALALFNVLAAGHIRSDEEEERRRQTGEGGRAVMRPWERTPDEKKMCDALEVVRTQVGAKNITAVAIAYVMHKAPYIFPIIGGRKVEHLQANIEALSIKLTGEQMAYLERILTFELGFPHRFTGLLGDYPVTLKATAKLDPQPLAPPITPS